MLANIGGDAVVDGGGQCQVEDVVGACTMAQRVQVGLQLKERLSLCIASSQVSVPLEKC